MHSRFSSAKELEQVLDRWRDIFEGNITQFNKERHDSNVSIVCQVVHEMCNMYDPTMDLEEVKMIGRRYKTKYLGLCDIIRRNMCNLTIPNETCTICLEDQSVEPVCCMLCLKVVGCKKCICEWIDYGSELARCLRCRRSFLKLSPMIHLAKQETSSAPSSTPSPPTSQAQPEQQHEEGEVVEDERMDEEAEGEDEVENEVNGEEHQAEDEETLQHIPSQSSSWAALHEALRRDQARGPGMIASNPPELPNVGPQVPQMDHLYALPYNQTTNTYMPNPTQHNFVSETFVVPPQMLAPHVYNPYAQPQVEEQRIPNQPQYQAYPSPMFNMLNPSLIPSNFTQPNYPSVPQPHGFVFPIMGSWPLPMPTNFPTPYVGDPRINLPPQYSQLYGPFFPDFNFHFLL